MGKPLVYGSILRFEGQVSVFDAARGPCYRCLYPEPPPPGLVPNCAEGGVLGVLCATIGSLQATEALKLILGKGDTLIGRFMLFDALGMKFREMKLRKDKDCPICGDKPTISELVDYEQFCGILPVEESAEDSALEIDAALVKEKLDGGNGFRLIDVREPSEYQICKIDGAVLIPLGLIQEKKIENLDGIGKNDEIVVHCKAGVRSLKAAKALKAMGFTNVKSMRGGIEEWADRIDPSVPKY